MKLVVGNQKSYMEKDKVDMFISGLHNIKTNNFILCPSSIYLYEFSKHNILLGSQNVSNYPSGATTGELSCEQLKSIGVKYSIVGHSERRELLKESIEDTNIKIKRLLDNEMTPILCVGETKEEKEEGKTKDIISSEVIGALKELDKASIEKIIIAYEPIWAIGTGLIPTNSDIEDITNYIKDIVKDSFDASVSVLYGGSVSLKNIDELNKIDIVDGYLIGGASTKIDELIEIVEKCKE